jgi:hypothetical protein
MGASAATSRPTVPHASSSDALPTSLLKKPEYLVAMATDFIGSLLEFH